MRDHARRSIAVAAVLAAVAGYVDAIGFLGTGRLFVSFMSGNSTQAAVGVESGAWSLAALAAALVAAFVVGVTAASLLARRASAADGGVARTRLLLVAVAGCLAVATALLAGSLALPWTYTLVAAAMGALNVIFADESRARVAVTYATGSLVSLGLGLAALVSGGSRTAWRRPLLLWTSLVSGAVLGAAAAAWLAWPALLVAIAVVVAVAALPARALRM